MISEPSPSTAKDAKTGKAGRERFLLLRTGSGLNAIPVRRVRRVRRNLLLHPVPGSDARLVGLAQHRGEPLTVLDLGVLVDGDEQLSEGQPITVVARAGAAENPETIGLAVDEAVDLVTIDEATITVLSEGLVAGETVVGSELVRILDLGALGEAP